MSFWTEKNWFKNLQKWRRLAAEGKVYEDLGRGRRARAGGLELCFEQFTCSSWQTPDVHPERPAPGTPGPADS